MSLPPLATAEDCKRYGYDDLGEEFLAQASARIRGYTGQDITEGTSTIKVHSGKALMPQRPVQDITSVTDSRGRDVTFRLLPGEHLELPFVADPNAASIRRDILTVTYKHGYKDGGLPEALVELCCGIANRISKTPDALALGFTSTQTGAESAGLGYDSYKGVTGLVSEEKAVLDRLFPRRSPFIGL